MISLSEVHGPLLQSSDEDTLRRMAIEFYKLIDQEDLGAFYNLWSKDNPNRDRVMNYIIERRKLGAWRPATSVSIRRVIIPSSIVRVILEQEEFDETTKQSTGMHKVYQSLIFVKSRSGWKIHQLLSTEYEIAYTVMTSAEKDQQQILEQNKEDIRPDWRASYIQRAEYFRRIGETDEAIMIL
jgi:hypothetical protein